MAKDPPSLDYLVVRDELPTEAVEEDEEDDDEEDEEDDPNAHKEGDYNDEELGNSDTKAGRKRKAVGDKKQLKKKVTICATFVVNIVG